MILEKGCAERGCACYDVRVDEGVEVKAVRELTDEEIMQVCSQIEPFDDITIEQAFIEFARAILKKASEK